jgi:hypothetical protein
MEISPLLSASSYLQCHHFSYIPIPTSLKIKIEGSNSAEIFLFIPFCQCYCSYCFFKREMSKRGGRRRKMCMNLKPFFIYFSNIADFIACKNYSISMKFKFIFSSIVCLHVTLSFEASAVYTLLLILYIISFQLLPFRFALKSVQCDSEETKKRGDLFC